MKRIVSVILFFSALTALAGCATSSRRTPTPGPSSTAENWASRNASGR